MDNATRNLNIAFADIFRRMEQETMTRESEAAKADPRKHRLSRVMQNGNLNYVYTNAGKDGRGSIVWFCRSTQRNVAGYFLAWRQVETKAKVKRDRWIASRSKKRVQDVCKKRAAAFRAAKG